MFFPESCPWYLCFVIIILWLSSVSTTSLPGSRVQARGQQAYHLTCEFHHHLPFHHFLPVSGKGLGVGSIIRIPSSILRFIMFSARSSATPPSASIHAIHARPPLFFPHIFRPFLSLPPARRCIACPTWPTSRAPYPPGCTPGAIPSGPAHWCRPASGATSPLNYREKIQIPSWDLNRKRDQMVQSLESEI